ncbi:hypothetical protein [Rhizobium bangladeshense]|uniref:hypothetical protein n=1 Tax=Rhizobium bangladeshense TaxID=1138189 RepID=UPI000AFF9A35|nr:hypothetical protein [Rhizobium bangladeshense]
MLREFPAHGFLNGNRDDAFKLLMGRGDWFAHGSPGSPDARDRAAVKSRDIYIPDLHIDMLKVKSGNFQ